jgi:hypothetical protein
MLRRRMLRRRGRMAALGVSPLSKRQRLRNAEKIKNDQLKLTQSVSIEVTLT